MNASIKFAYWRKVEAHEQEFFRAEARFWRWHRRVMSPGVWQSFLSSFAGWRYRVARENLHRVQDRLHSLGIPLPGPKTILDKIPSV